MGFETLSSSLATVAKGPSTIPILQAWLFGEPVNMCAKRVMNMFVLPFVFTKVYAALVGIVLSIQFVTC